jgi:hypothetical protein
LPERVYLGLPKTRSVNIGEDLDGAPGKAHLDLGADEAVGNAVEMALDIDW